MLEPIGAPIDIFHDDPNGSQEEYLGVIPHLSSIGPEEGYVTIECRLKPHEALELLQTDAPLALATQYGMAKGMRSPRIKDIALRPYAIDRNGNQLGLQGQVAAYRMVVPLISN